MKWLWLTVLIALSDAAAAEVVTVRSGEHEGFTRLVLQLSRPVEWHMGRTDDGYELQLDRADTRYDLSSVFRTIPRDRLASVWAEPATGRLRIGIGCACHALAFEFRPDVLVVDIKDGQPPAGSAFEMTLAGGTTSALAPRQPKRPRSRPPTAPAGLDWTRAIGTIPPETPLASPLPGADLAGMRAALLREVARGASMGALDIRRAERAAPTAVGRTAPDAGPAKQITAGFGPGVETTTPGEPREALTASGRPCLPDSVLAIGNWADERSFSEQLAEGRSGLVGEFDRIDPEAAARHVRLHLYFGFGAEARVIRRQLAADNADSALWDALAQILDGGHAPPGSVLSDQDACDSAAALWSVLARPELRRSDKINKTAVLRSFSALPIHLRRHLGPGLSDRFLAVGDTATARAIRDAILRAPGDPGAATRLIDAKIDLSLGQPARAEKEIVAVAAAGGPESPRAMIDLVSARLAQGQVIDEKTILALSALSREHSGAPLGSALARALMLALASAGAYDQAFDLGNVAGQAAVTETWAMLASSGPDSALLAHAVLSESAEVPPIDSPLKARIAKRLIDLGFAEAGMRWLTPLDVSPEHVVLWAEAELARKDARAALRLLAGRTEAEAEVLRARAETQLGDLAAAAAAWAAAGQPEAARRASWQARDWTAVARDAGASQDPAAVSLARTVLNVPDPDRPAPPPGDAPLSAGRALVAESARARSEIGALLAAVPGPTGAQP